MARTKHTVYKSTGEWIPSRPIHGGKGPRHQLINPIARFPTKKGKAPRQQMIVGCGKKTIRPASFASRPRCASKSCEDDVTRPTNTRRARSAKCTTTTEPAATTAEPEAAATEPDRDNDKAFGRPLRLRRPSSRLDPTVWDLK